MAGMKTAEERGKSEAAKSTTPPPKSAFSTAKPISEGPSAHRREPPESRAKRIFEEARRLSEKGNARSTNKAASLFEKAGWLFSRIECWADAAESFLKAAQLMENQDPAKLSSLYANAADNYLFAKRRADAAEIYLKAASPIQGQNPNLAALYLERAAKISTEFVISEGQDPARVFSLFIRARDLYIKAGEPRGAADCCADAAWLMDEQDPAKAFSLYEEAGALYNKSSRRNIPEYLDHSFMSMADGLATYERAASLVKASDSAHASQIIAKGKNEFEASLGELMKAIRAQIVRSSKERSIRTWLPLSEARAKASIDETTTTYETP